VTQICGYSDSESPYDGLQVAHGRRGDRAFTLLDPMKRRPCESGKSCLESSRACASCTSCKSSASGCRFQHLVWKRSIKLPLNASGYRFQNLFQGFNFRCLATLYLRRVIRVPLSWPCVHRLLLSTKLSRNLPKPKPRGISLGPSLRGISLGPSLRGISLGPSLRGISLGPSLRGITQPSRNLARPQPSRNLARPQPSRNLARPQSR
jgi:hypothetical protein